LRKTSERRNDAACAQPSDCCFIRRLPACFFNAHPVPKTLCTFRDAVGFSRASYSENRFALFGMRDNLAVRRFPFQKSPDLMSLAVNPADNLAALIRCASVTPAEGGALTALEAMLKPMGFSVERPVFHDEDTPDIENLYARKSGNGPHPMSCLPAMRATGNTRPFLPLLKTA